MLIQQHMEERAAVEEELESIQTQRVLRRARKYYIVTPPIKMAGDDYEDENWERGWASGTLYLKPAAVASLQRQIEEARSRRREAWATWAKIISGLITTLVALVSVLALALRK